MINTKELIDSFLQAQDGLLSDSTISWYQMYLRPLAKHYGEREISSLTIDDLRWLFQKKKEEVSSVFSLFNFVRAWKRIFRWASDENLIPSNPAKRLRLPPLPKKSPSAISDLDIEKMLKAAKTSSAPERNYAIIAFLRDTGARVGGVASLTTKYIYLEQRRAIVQEKGRGGKKERQVFFTSSTAQAIQNWLNVRCQANNDERLFLLTANGIYQVLERIAQTAKISGRWNPHSFRHAFARRMLAKGASIGIVSHLMGHSNVQVTLDFYGRFSNDELQEIYDRLIK